MGKIPEHLKEIISNIPASVGIYKMKDKDGNIIYVGKSKSLKSRVKSYFYKVHDWDKIDRLVFSINDIEYIETDTHLEALLLECKLIKDIKPIYNAQYKNHSKYLYLKILDYNKHKPLGVSSIRDSDLCYGPYRNKYILNSVITFFKNIYPLSKDKGIYNFDYKIIPNSIDKDYYQNNKQYIEEILSSIDNMNSFIEVLENKMNDASINLQFEKARIYRDMINNIKYIHRFNVKLGENLTKIILGKAINDKYLLFYIVDGNIISKMTYDKISTKVINDFIDINNDTELESIVDEKRDIDFKFIVHSEIQDPNTAVMFLDEDYDIDDFNKKLLTLG